MLGLKIAMEWRQIVLNFCFYFARTAVRLTKKSIRREVRKLLNVSFGFFDAKERRRLGRRVHDCRRLVTDRTHDAFSTEIF